MGCSKHLDHSLLLSLKQRRNENGKQRRKYSSGLSQSLNQPPNTHPIPIPIPPCPRHQLIMCSASKAETGSCWPLVLTINTMTEKQKVSELRAGTETATSLSKLGGQEAGESLAVCRAQGKKALTGC